VTILTIFLFLLGLGLLTLGAEWMVRGASHLAARLGVSPLIIGLTVVAFGTSSPEMAVSVQSALLGRADITVGNVVGSNIFNILFILGISAAITPLVVRRQLIYLDVPIMIGVSFLAYGMALDGQMVRWEAALLFLGILSYTAFSIYQSRKEQDVAVQKEYLQEFAFQESGWKTWAINIALLAVGFLFLVYGSNLLVENAAAIARWLGLSELIIGLTIVAAGTSMPEVATSVVAAIKGERDIAVGNAIGSNIFNLLAVLGLGGMVAPNGLLVSDAAIGFDFPVMIAVAVITLPILFTDRQISRWEGGILFAYYVAYTAYLILQASQHDALPIFNQIMLWGIIPLTLLTVLLDVMVEFYKARQAT